MAPSLATLAILLVAGSIVCESAVILSAPDANVLRGFTEGDAPLQRDRRAFFSISNDTGYVFPPLSLERDIVGPLRQFVYEGSPAYDLLEQNFDPFTVFAAAANSQEFPQLMSARLRRTLVKLAELVKAVKITNADGTTSEARLIVIRAYKAPVAGITDPLSTDIRYEGRKAQISIVKVGTTTPLTGQGVFARLAELAWDAGADFISTSVSWNRLDISVVPDRCGADLDLAFLLDGSKSLTDQGWKDQMQFVKDITSFFTINTNRTRVSITTFHGPLISHISYNASIPSCPVGTIWEPDGDGCVCPQNSLCSNTADTRNNPGCSQGYYEAVAGACANANQPNFDITKAPGCELRNFFIHACKTCTCKPLGQIYTYADSYTLNQMFNATTDRAALNKTVNDIVFPAGATHMRVGMEIVDSTVFRLGSGMRPSNQGVPRVLIVVTDGKSNPGYEPFAAALTLKNKGINIFAVGVGDAYEPELDQMASNPRYKFLLNSADALYSIVDRLSYAQCEIPGVLETGTTIDVNLARDEYRYIQAECNGDSRLVTENVVAELTTSTGSMSLHLSNTDPNPTPIRSVVSAGGAVNPKSLIMDRSVGAGLGSVYLGMYGIDLANTASLTVWQQVFTQYVAEVSVSETTLVNTVVTAAPAMAPIPSHTPVWSYRLDKTINGDGFFTLSTTTGRLTLVRKLDHETRNSFKLKIWAQDTSTSCIVGYQLLTIKVADVNDNRPVFSKTTYVASLIEDVAGPKRRNVGQKLVTLEATDADSAAITTITYKFLTGNEKGLFSLDAKTGEITQILPVDYEIMGGSKLTLTAVAEDGFGGVSDPCTILITIIDQDDPPYFTQVNAAGVHPDMSVPENRPIGIIAPLEIGDDKTITPFTCSMIEGDATRFAASASADLKYCNIRSIKSLATLGGTSYTVKVQLKTASGYTADAQVKLNIVDSNDFPPVFDKPIYNVIAANTQPVGSVVVSPFITDADGTTDFKCSVSSGAGSQYFAFDHPTNPCVLRVKSLFPTTSTSFSLIIETTDGFLSDQAKVEITVYRGCAYTFQCPAGYACASEITGNYMCTCLDESAPGLTCPVDYCNLADPSDGNPCENGATCVNGKSDYTCTGCPVGVVGKNCDTVPDLCEPNPCLNEGTCTRVSSISASSNILNSYRCDCVDGFYGMDCASVDPTADACADQPCDNGATCVRASSVVNGPKDTFECQCLDHSFGKTCTDTRETCDPNALCNPDSAASCTGTCQNGGVCAPDNQGGVCRCTDLFYGATCEIPETVADPCSSNPCLNGGACTRASSARNGPKDMFVCECAEGFEGFNCADSKANCEAAGATCLNDGVCTATADGGQCQCVSNPGECYLGTRCERFFPGDCSEASTSEKSSAANNAAMIGGIIAGVLIVCILVLLVVAYRRRQNKSAPHVPLGAERTRHFDNPTFVSPNGSFIGGGQGMPDDGMSNPMYGMGAVNAGGNYGSHSNYDSVSGNGNYDTVAPLHPNQNFQMDRGNLRLQSVSRKNPMAAESSTDEGFANPMYGAGSQPTYGGRDNASINPSYLGGMQMNKSAGLYSDADSAYNKEGLYADADQAGRSNGLHGNPTYATSPAAAAAAGRNNGLHGNPTYATSPSTYGERANGLHGNPTYDNKVNVGGVSPVYDLAAPKAASDTGYLDVQMQKNRADLSDYTTAQEMRQNLSVVAKGANESYLTVANKQGTF